MAARETITDEGKPRLPNAQ